MNLIHARMARAAATQDFSHVDRIQFCYMDGYPTDFPARTSDRPQVLVAAFGAQRSHTLRSPLATTMLLNNLPLVSWKLSDDAYKAAFAEAIRTAALREPIKAFTLVYQPSHLFTIGQALWVKHFGVGQEPAFSQRYEDQAGRDMLRFTHCLDHRDPANPQPICMSRDKFTILLLWAEFLIKVFNEVQDSVLSIGDAFDGLAVFSDLLSGDSEDNGDRGASVLRSLINDAYRDRVTFQNYNALSADTHVGDILADNLAGCVGRSMRQTGKPFLNEQSRRLAFHYYCLDAWADVVPWSHYRRILVP